MIEELIPNTAQRIKLPQQSAEPYYIDDLFDPFFNTEARKYLKGKYALPTIGGLYENLRNAWTGHKGFFGPGMGVLSSFGRTMDKADDLFIGMAAGDAPSKVLTNVFVKDQDYTGKDALANIINGLAPSAELDPANMKGFGWGAASLATELILDPGIMAMKLGRIASKSAHPVLQATSELLGGYDDAVAKMAINAVAPGSTAAVKGSLKALKRLRQMTGANSAENLVDAAIKPGLETKAPGSPLDGGPTPPTSTVPPVIPPTGGAPTVPPTNLTPTVKEIPVKPGRTSTAPKNVSPATAKLWDQIDNSIANLEVMQKDFMRDQFENIADLPPREADLLIQHIEDSVKDAKSIKKNLTDLESAQAFKHTLTSQHDEYYDEVYNMVDTSGKKTSRFDNDVIPSVHKLKDPIEKQMMTQFEDTAVSKLDPTPKIVDQSSLVREGLEKSEPELQQEFVNFFNNNMRPYITDSVEVQRQFGKKDTETIDEFLDAFLERNIKDKVWLDTPYGEVGEQYFEQMSKLGTTPRGMEDFARGELSPLELVQEEIGSGPLAMKHATDVMDNQIKPNFIGDKSFKYSTPERKYQVNSSSQYNAAQVLPLVNFTNAWAPKFLKRYNIKNIDELKDLLSSSISNKGYADIKLRTTQLVQELKTARKQYAELVEAKGDFAKIRLAETQMKQLQQKLKNYMQMKNFIDDTSLLLGTNSTKDTYGKKMVNLLSTRKAIKNILSSTETGIDKSDAGFMMLFNRKANDLTVASNPLYDLNIFLDKLSKASKESFERYSITETIDDILNNPANMGKITPEMLLELKAKVPNIEINDILAGKRILTQDEMWRDTLKNYKILATKKTALTPQELVLGKKLQDEITKEFPTLKTKDAIFSKLKELDATIKAKNGYSKDHSFYPNIVKSNNFATPQKITQESVAKAKPAVDIIAEDLTKSVKTPLVETVKTLETSSTELAQQTALDSAAKSVGMAPEVLANPAVAKEVRQMFPKDSPTGRLFELADAQVKSFRGTQKANEFGTINRMETKLTTLRKTISKASPKLQSKIIQAMDESQDFVLNKSELIKDFVLSRGMKLTKVDDIKKIDELRDYFTKVAKSINDNSIISKSDAAPIVDVIEKKSGSHTYIGIALNTSGANKNLANRYFKAISGHGTKWNLDATLPDVMELYKGKPLSLLDDSSKELLRQYQDVMHEVQNHYRTLGYADEITDTYIQHTYKDTELSGKYLEQIYGASHDTRIAHEISMDIANKLHWNKSFGSILKKRSLEAPISVLNTNPEYAQIFEDANLESIARSALSTGVLDNKNYQSFVDLVLNENYSIKERFNDVTHLKEVLGKGGNMDNFSIVRPQYDAAGQIVRLKRLNKLSDDALQDAFKDNSAVLVHNAVFTPFDRVLKKEWMMNDKVFAFLNKNFTVPFKFGVLTNPAFILGNITDAFTKSVLTDSVKYDKSLVRATINYSKAIRDVVSLNNSFINVYERFLSTSKLNVPYEQLVENPTYRKKFVEWLDAPASLATPDEHNIVYTFFMLNDAQPMTIKTPSQSSIKTVLSKETATTSETLKEVGMESQKANYPIKDPNPMRRILYGTDKHWGLFLNNPASNAILGASALWERLARSAHILTELQEKGMLNKAGSMTKNIGDEMSEKAHIAMLDALDKMNTSHFSYEDVTEFMANFSKFVPFPTFFVKNLSYWLEMAMDHPQVIDTIIAAQNTAWGDTSQEELEKDEFLHSTKGRGALPTGNSYLKVNPANSMFSAFNAMNEPLQTLAYRLNPLTRPFTKGVNKPEDVNYRPYTTKQFQKNVRSNEPNFSNLEYLLHSANPYDRAINTYLRMPRKVATGNAQLSDFTPSVFQPNFNKKT